MKIVRGKIIKVILWALLSIALFMALAALLRYFLVPNLPQHWQSDLTWLGGATIITLSILSGFAQLTGFSIKELLAPEKRKTQVYPSKNLEGTVILNAEASGTTDWKGDILQGKSTKVIIERAGDTEMQGDTKRNKIDSLIREIQKSLYGENELLPYALTLCLDLCSQLNMDKDYCDWLKRELNGYEEYEEFQKGFGDADEFEVWVKKWASHRWINTYMKASMPDENRSGYKIVELPYDKIFVAFPIAQIVRMTNDARKSGQQELFVLLRSLGTEHIESFQKFMSKLTPTVNIPSDLRLFYSLSELEHVFTGAREIVLSFLSEARKEWEEIN